MSTRTNAIETYKNLAQVRQGPERVWAYRNYILVSQGFLSSDELIDMALAEGFMVENPFTKVRRGSRISKGVFLSDRAAIEGQDVSVGADTVIAGAIRGDNVHFGSGNQVLADIDIGNLRTGAGNRITGLRGDNQGGLVVGDHNAIASVSVTNRSKDPIVVGDHNELCPGLSLNVPFSGGRIMIGDYNSLGRDGGGVVSSSYRFGRKWNGCTIIGSRVETTRGAEVLGFSILGWPLNQLLRVTGKDEADLIRLVVEGSLKDLTEELVAKILASNAESNQQEGKSETVSLFGPVKVKRCILAGKVTLKDDTRTQNAYVRDALLPERSKIFYSSIVGAPEEIITVSVQDRAFDNVAVRQHLAWQDFPTVVKCDEYPLSDCEFYGDTSWDVREGRRG